MGAFDDDTALVRDGDVWRGEVSPRWHVGAGPGGGYLASYPLRAALDLAPLPDPLSMTTHYHQRPAYGPIELRPRLLHATKGHAYLAVDAEQEHGTVLAALVTRACTAGYIEEDGELWGGDGRLVAMSRQLARYVPADAAS